MGYPEHLSTIAKALTRAIHIFILIIELLQQLFSVASNMKILDPLARVGFSHQLSIFADDDIIFLKHDDIELKACSNYVGHAWYDVRLGCELSQNGCLADTLI